MPQIAVINESTTVADAAVQGMLPAFGQQWNNDLRPVWGVDEATFVWTPQGQAPPDGSWWLVFLDDLVRAAEPRYARIVAKWNVRGGIYTDVVAEFRQKGWKPAPRIELPEAPGA